MSDNGSCEGCKKPIAADVLPAQAVLLLPHGRCALQGAVWPPKSGALAFRAESIARFCTVACLRDWCARIEGVN
jgi:hypothetical protein